MVDIENNIVLFASYDIYTPNKEFNCNKDFDWDIQGGNLYDEKVQKWKKEYPELIINSIHVNYIGDLCMHLSNSHVMEIFINTSSDSECWRFFECNTGKKHLVFKGTGIIFL